MKHLHTKLTQKYQIYNNWHQTKHHNKAHWGVFVVFSFVLFSLILNVVSAYDAAGNESTKSTSASAATLAQTGNTYYMGNSGSDSNTAVQAQDRNTPWKTLGYAVQQMSANDTLIILDGTYTGDGNAISAYGAHPPNGTGVSIDPNNGYTVIQAENDGQVLFDGENTRRMFYFNGAGPFSYWKFRGIKWGNTNISSGNSSTVMMYNFNHVKFIRSAAFNGADGNASNWNINNSSYVLLEESYAWGSGRYKFVVYLSDHVIIRRSVGRPDAINTIHPISVFQNYSSQYVLFQNNIALDADESYWVNYSWNEGAFTTHSLHSGEFTANSEWNGNIAVNIEGPFLTLVTDATNLTFKNMIGWNIGDGIQGNSNTTTSLDHFTIGKIDRQYRKRSSDPLSTVGYGIENWNSTINLINSIVYGAANTGIASVNASNYNALYNNNADYSGVSAGANDFSAANSNAVDVLDGTPGNGMATVKYLPRIENNSDLDGATSDGTDRGATVMTKIGVSGTLWGETGYNTDTGEALWPFPYEAQIKTDMATYNLGGIDPTKPDGKRGFAADGIGLYGGPISLTSYIWEYLGNPCPSEICNYKKTYYISPTGNDTNGDGSNTSPWATLSKAFSQMQGGDTLVIRDGIYTGVSNAIEDLMNTVYPPNGSPGNYTIIRAENEGKVVFDGEGVRSMFHFGKRHSYLQFQGIKWINHGVNFGVLIVNGDHIKILQSGAGDNTNNDGYLAKPFSIQHSSYILLEDVYAWGAGRYKFEFFASDHIICRRCVARTDATTGLSNITPSVIGIFQNYCSQYVEYQNSIAIDTDTPQYWTQYYELQGGFVSHPYCDFYNEYSENTSYRGSVALNVQQTSGGHSETSRNFYYENFVGWDTLKGLIGASPAVPYNVTINHSLFGNMSVGDGINEFYPNTSYAVRNSIFYNIKGNALNKIASSNYNSLYANDKDYSGISPGPNDLSAANGSAINPITGTPGNGTPALKYLLRVEDGSNLDGRASDGGDIGATILTKIGVSGTMYGDPGYNTDTGEPLWPFPYEDTIKQAFASYNPGGTDTIKPDGKRGFAADGTDQFGKPLTLTRYIWQYLGNQIPCEIYNECGGIPDTTSPTIPTNLTATAVSSSQINLSWTASTDTGGSGLAGYKIYRNGSSLITQNSKLTTFSDTGLTASTAYTYSISAYDAAGNESAKSTQASVVTQSQTGKTYYISPSGDDANLGASQAPFATFNRAFQVMQGGDTLIVKDGIYNQSLMNPPSGTESAYTIVKAENNFKLIIDGEGLANPALFIQNGRHHIQIEGLHFRNGDTSGSANVGQIGEGLRGDLDQPADGAYNVNIFRNIFQGRNQSETSIYASIFVVSVSNNIRLEENISFGKANKYHFYAWKSSNVIMRRNFARWDAVNPAAQGSGHPSASFVFYDTTDSIMENNIAVDGLQTSTTDTAVFYMPGHYLGGSNNKFLGNIALNNLAAAGFQLDPGADYRTDRTNPIYWNNQTLIDNVAWLNRDDPATPGIQDGRGIGINIGQSGTGGPYMDNVVVSHNTVGKNTLRRGINIHHNITNVSFKNNLILDNQTAANCSDSTLNLTNSLLFNNAGITSGTGCTYNLSNNLTNNPNFKYLPRIESGSPAKGTADDGGDRGANILTRYENGILTQTNLWPFPNEGAIKKAACTDTGETRGFCSSATLTKYIWEYLGNQIPCEIYNECGGIPDTTSPTIPANLTATAISSSQINLSWTASTDTGGSGLTGYKIYRCAGSTCAPTTQIATSATNSYPNAGLTASTAYTYTVSAYDAAGNNSAKSSSVPATTSAGFKPSDLNQDGFVNQLDFDILKQDWNRTDKPISDINQDGVVDSRDLGIMMSEWTR